VFRSEVREAIVRGRVANLFRTGKRPPSLGTGAVPRSGTGDSLWFQVLKRDGNCAVPCSGTWNKLVGLAAESDSTWIAGELEREAVPEHGTASKPNQGRTLQPFNVPEHGTDFATSTASANSSVEPNGLFPVPEQETFWINVSAKARSMFRNRLAGQL
jgi:hypothetical protein